MMQEESPYQFSDLAGLMQQTHSLYHEMVQSCAGSGNQSRWAEVEDSFARMFKMVSTQVPLIQVKFQGKLAACQDARAALKVENQKLADELQLCKAKIRVQSVKPTTQADNDDLKNEENEILRAQVVESQRKLAKLQSDLHNAQKELLRYANLDDECHAQISDLTNANFDLKQQVGELQALLQQLREGSVVPLSQDGSQHTFSGDGEGK